MKSKFKDLTFLIPIRIDSTHRLNNLKTVLAFYNKNIDVQFIILEADNCPKVEASLSRFKNVKYRFIKDEKTIFHRTKFINIMLGMADTKYAAVWDTDVIIPINQILEALQFLREEKCILAYPYDGKMWSINEAFSECFIKKLNLSILTDFPQSRYLLSGYYSVGGAFIVDVAEYKRKGWENENFVGWGPEDVERYKRLEILGSKPMRSEGSLYHLYHPRNINSGDFDHNTAFTTKKEYCKVCSMGKKQLQDYITTWNWIK